jgi:hypothetical protein
LQRIPLIPTPEPPQVTTKSDLGSISSQSSRSRNKVEDVLKREIDNEDRNQSDPGDDAPPPPEEVDGEDELVHIKNMGNHILSLDANVKEMKTGIDKMTRLSQKTPNGIHRDTIPREQVVWDVLGGIRDILWVWRLEPTSWKGIQLGPGFWVLCLLAIPLYVVAELIMCMIYCRPVIADSMEGMGTCPDAPEMPFVIPTVLLRPFRPVWKPLIALLKPVFIWLARFLTYMAKEDNVNEL